MDEMQEEKIDGKEPIADEDMENVSGGGEDYYVCAGDRRISVDRNSEVSNSDRYSIVGKTVAVVSKWDAWDAIFQVTGTYEKRMSLFTTLACFPGTTVFGMPVTEINFSTYRVYTKYKISE